MATTTTYEVRHISVSINRAPLEVYDYASKPENLPTWAAGLAGSIRQIDGEWVADAPVGKVRIRFVERNQLGVLDHDVTILESGATTHNPMRVLPNRAGSEVVFTLYHLPESSDAQFAKDAQAVTRDLQALKAVLER